MVSHRDYRQHWPYQVRILLLLSTTAEIEEILAYCPNIKDLILEICCRVSTESRVRNRHMKISRLGIRSCQCTSRTTKYNMKQVVLLVQQYCDRSIFPNIGRVHLLDINTSRWRAVSGSSSVGHLWNHMIRTVLPVDLDIQDNNQSSLKVVLCE